MRRSLSPSASPHALALIGLSLIAAAACAGPQQAATGTVAARPPPEPLEPDRTVERVIANGEPHLYELELEAGDFLHLHAEQLGADVVLTLLDPSGAPVVHADTFTASGDDEAEDLYAEIAASGRHRIEVSTFDFPCAEGRYALRIVERRPLQPGDRERIEAEKLYQDSVDETLDDEWRAALGSLVAAVAAFERLGDRERWADALSERCRVLWKLGLRRETTDLCEPLIEVYQRQERPGREAKVLQILGLCYRDLGQPQMAIDRLRRAVAIRKPSTHLYAKARAQQWLGLAYQDVKAFHEALLHYRRALPVWRRCKILHQIGWLQRNVGQIHLSLGRPAAARRCFEEALALYENDQTEERAQTMIQLGLALHQLGLEREALERLHQALALQADPLLGRDRALTMTSIGLVHGANGRPDEALRWYLAALPLARREDPDVLAHLHHNVAWNLDQKGAHDAALPLFVRALAEYQEQGDDWAQARTLLGLARAEHARGRPDLALPPIQTALDLLEKVRRELVRPDLRIDYMAGRQDHYDLAVELLMDLHRERPAEGWDARALDLVEQAHARGMLDLVHTLPAERHGPLDPELAEEERELAATVNAAASRRRELQAAAASEEELAKAETELVEALDALHGLRAEIERARGGRAAPAQAEPVTAVTLRGGLIGADELLLVYRLAEPHSFLWTISGDRLESYELPPGPVLEARARRAHDLLREPPGHTSGLELDRILSQLGDALLAPAASRLGARRVLAVPEGALLYLPFAALRSPANGGPLVADHEVVTLPSASVLAALRQRPAREPAPVTLAVIADPVFDAGDPRSAGAGLNPPSAGGPPAGGGAGGGGLARLRHSRSEAIEILSLVPPDDRIAALGFDARREAVLDGLPSDARYVHVATHVEIDPRYPEVSRLVLTRVDPDGRPLETGDVLAHELFGLDLAADLVTLSACDTALGREVRGEGLVGLAHGLFRAGANGLLLTLWPVDDEATETLMIQFYRHLLTDGQTPAAALRAAQREVAGDARWRAPYYWAGFVLVGEGVPSRQ